MSEITHAIRTMIRSFKGSFKEKVNWKERKRGRLVDGTAIKRFLRFRFIRHESRMYIEG